MAKSEARYSLAGAMREIDEPGSHPASILPAEMEYAQAILRILEAQGWRLVRDPR